MSTYSAVITFAIQKKLLRTGTTPSGVLLLGYGNIEQEKI